MNVEQTEMIVKPLDIEVILALLFTLALAI